ncbi:MULTISPECIES: D-alanyl-D-alanine carboxypeptidase/D-alanyl-D-alanine-endopeptidase [unclassified Nocardiopsis]|uniref:D-alanyl-D-alanine carboxypeptidase/D-alanyl-D-alanine endopeptidase n=1 Tax=unclassified Nocardiopsis TaxID=2649073 RepID=UPI001356CAB7|nr:MULTISPECIES: D-alanyl-D-alanine carboxypeptidase/D-alanyl-D-alanine-endopeptidase [unclassified Nocardiopsis]
MLAASVLAASPAHADTPEDRLGGLRQDIDALLADPALEGAVSGVVVVDPGTGETLYSRDGGARLLPASNAKLFTSAAALEVLGADRTFTTEVVARGGDGRHGRRGHRGSVEDLYLVGGGDPTLSADDLDALAADVAASGVTTVRGDVYADDTWFDSERLVGDWWPEDEPYAYSAQISALTVAHGDRYDTGVTEVSVSPAAQGQPAEVDLGAAEGYAELDNRAVTGAPGSGNTLVVDRPVGTNTITVSGSIPAGGATVSVLRTVDEPAGLAAHLFEQALERHGVAVRGGVEFGAAPEGGRGVRVLAEHESPALEEILVPFMKFSNNGHAEMLVKSIGREVADEGSWAAGLAGVEEAVAGLGVDTSDLVLNDGSGLSRSNLVTADTVVDLLVRSRAADWHGMWEESLPVAGASDPFTGGTLRFRMGGTAAEGVVEAKTGTMSGVSALSGYVPGPDGGGLVFSVVNNGHSGPAPTGVQDAIAVRLAEHLGHQAPLGVRSQSAPAQGGGELECSWELTC